MNIFAEIYPYYVFFTHNLLLVLVLYARMAFLQESALKEALESFSMLPKAEGINEQFVVRFTVVLVPVTGCSPWDDFVALRCQAGQHALALGHVSVRR